MQSQNAHTQIFQKRNSPEKKKLYLRECNWSTTFGFLIFLFNVVVPVFFFLKSLIRSGFNHIGFSVWQCATLVQVCQRNEINQTVDVFNQWATIAFVQNKTIDKADQCITQRRR